jgi:hypothetical protein
VIKIEFNDGWRLAIVIAHIMSVEIHPNGKLAIITLANKSFKIDACNVSEKSWLYLVNYFNLGDVR